MKMKKRFMIALAGAMVIGAFGTSSIPMMAANPNPPFTVTIPASLPITQIGYNSVEISAVNNKSGCIDVTASDSPDRPVGPPLQFLVNKTGDKIPFLLCQPGHVDTPATNWFFYDHGENTKFFDVYLFTEDQINDHLEDFGLTEAFHYDSLSPGEYEGKVYFTAVYIENQQ